jgi:hypothetical protein
MAHKRRDMKGGATVVVTLIQIATCASEAFDLVDGALGGGGVETAKGR